MTDDPKARAAYWRGVTHQARWVFVVATICVIGFFVLLGWGLQVELRKAATQAAVLVSVAHDLRSVTYDLRERLRRLDQQYRLVVGMPP